MAKALRKGPFQTQLLMGGVDKRAEGKAEASLFWLDYLGTMQKVITMTAPHHTAHSTLLYIVPQINSYLAVPAVHGLFALEIEAIIS